MLQKIHKKIALVSLLAGCMLISACSNSNSKGVNVAKPASSKIYKARQGQIRDQIFAVSSLSEHQRDWKGTRYRLGGASRRGVDCSAFMQITFRDLFGIDLPRTTTEQAKKGRKIAKSELQAGDLVFFKTGRGPNGKHVGVYVKNGQFLHASTKGGVIYSDLNSPYWTKTYWQARRL